MFRINIDVSLLEWGALDCFIGGDIVRIMGFRNILVEIEIGGL